MDRVTKIKTMLQETPRDSFLQHALALEYVKLGNDAEARRLFENIIAGEPGYIGTYYHLAKLLERLRENDEATRIYERGMAEARKAGDEHSYNELKSAYEELIY